MSPDARIAVGGDASTVERVERWMPAHYDIVTVSDAEGVVAVLEDGIDKFILKGTVWRLVADKFAAIGSDVSAKVAVLGNPVPDPAEYGLGVSLPTPVSERTLRKAVAQLIRVQAYEQAVDDLFHCLAAQARFEADHPSGEDRSDTNYLTLLVKIERLQRRIEHLTRTFDSDDFDVALSSFRTARSPASVRVR